MTLKKTRILFCFLFAMSPLVLNAEEMDLLEVQQEVFEAVNWNWRPPGWIILFEPKRAGLRGKAYLQSSKIVIWVRKSDTTEELAETLVHELAHAYSKLHITKDMREEWLVTRGLSSQTAWYSPMGESDYGCGEGDFAESVSFYFQEGGFRGELGPPPNKQQKALLRRWLENPE